MMVMLSPSSLVSAVILCLFSWPKNIYITLKSIRCFKITLILLMWIQKIFQLSSFWWSTFTFKHSRHDFSERLLSLQIQVQTLAAYSAFYGLLGDNLTFLQCKNNKPFDFVNINDSIDIFLEAKQPSQCEQHCRRKWQVPFILLQPDA